MDPAAAATAALAAAAVLGGLWAAATRRHRQRRELSDADWRGTEARAEVWTSRARCPDCSASGGVLSYEDDLLWFTCLECGSRHRRRERG